MSDPRLVLVAHGTRNPAGVEVIAALADAVAPHVGPVRVAFVDVLGPTPSEVLRDVDGPVVVVPAFLASGYHVHADVPREIAESGHDDVHVTRALGPDLNLARVLRDRLKQIGWTTGDRIVLAAAGSSDVRALDDVHTAADQLAAVTGSAVTVAYVATGKPRAADLVPTLKATGEKVFVASYLLAPGLFHTRLQSAGADGVTEPLGLHGGVVQLLVDRYREGVDVISAAAARSRRERPDSDRQ
ncbi:sirohydrochlorin chelatase [Rhodococcus sp. BP-349]|uniref:sirohydrochlorin chelatase n=1 Tax=unclassified Rhodococcus (in: high G+C Gram-positive bacteria) TaxID=192944 RepID=UPI001C9B28AA|nr:MULTISPECIES: sirohydrochlorin chelatase [unclassified Rhodococcus (in: high G+C Gram-positive bacteria)]MBY6538968.1 sirohydrochlorin chelatase [Rhodococcus sp. BP-363]MBY6543305.1 sirohydrochlorin chelatase [Rhodococcus sp. BP-369]MBY6562535.1 sirohydrochlorin chelatase [Rhodococcus sp. BP-370]MBY6576827.1 sirohydrochlorin chelatase [Rhodococcus sp. BP-364]MBY6586128.1 sirohydrochlorin chelatase [Rhodococcus sp. BP-358]